MCRLEVVLCFVRASVSFQRLFGCFDCSVCRTVSYTRILFFPCLS